MFWPDIDFQNSLYNVLILSCMYRRRFIPIVAWISLMFCSLLVAALEPSNFFFHWLRTPEIYPFHFFLLSFADKTLLDKGRTVPRIFIIQIRNP
jgi:hypothetical protein